MRCTLCQWLKLLFFLVICNAFILIHACFSFFELRFKLANLILQVYDRQVFDFHLQYLVFTCSIFKIYIIIKWKKLTYFFDFSQATLKLARFFPNRSYDALIDWTSLVLESISDLRSIFSFFNLQIFACNDLIAFYWYSFPLYLNGRPSFFFKLLFIISVLLILKVFLITDRVIVVNLETLILLSII